MYSSCCIWFTTTSKCNIGFTINFWECWIKVLRVVIIKRSGRTIVFFTNIYKRTHVFRWLFAQHFVSITYSIQSWSVIDTFFVSLCIILSLFDWERIRWFKSRPITPICSLWFCFIMTLFSGPSIEVWIPCLASTKVIPVKVSVKRNKASQGPKNPSTLPDHPGVRLPHVISYVKHHRLL